MRYEQSAATGDEGEAAVALIIARTVKWIFRRVSGPDFGIDGIVEQVQNDQATGRWISLQIKSGESYFRESSLEGVVFRESDKSHLEYYRMHQLPVIMVLHYSETDDAIWQWVADDTVVETALGWKLLVPHGQRLDATTAAAWTRHLGRRVNVSPPRELRSEPLFIDGSLGTFHDVLGRAEYDLMVSAPFLSIDMLTLLDFMASKLRVRVLTSPTTLDEPLLQAIGIAGRLEIRFIGDLHLKAILVDREVACLTSASFTRRGTATAREVVRIRTSGESVRMMVRQFEELWSKACPSEATKDV